MLHHHAVNNNTFSTFLGQKCFEFLFSGPAQQYLSSIMILDNGFGQNVTYLSKSPRNPTVSSKLVSVVGSHAMRDIECRKNILRSGSVETSHGLVGPELDNKTIIKSKIRCNYCCDLYIFIVFVMRAVKLTIEKFQSVKFHN